MSRRAQIESPGMENTMQMSYAGSWEGFKVSDEERLISAAQKGDLEAFNQLVLLYQERIYNLALRILGDADSAEDITQNTFLNAYRSLSGFRNGSFRNWLFRICTNSCYDELRVRKRYILQSLEYEDTSEEIPLPASDFPGSTASPEREYEKRELEQTVQKALSQLDPDHRAVMVLVDLQDFDYQEAAQVLQVPIGTIKSRLARARTRMRFLLRTANQHGWSLN